MIIRTRALQVSSWKHRMTPNIEAYSYMYELQRSSTHWSTYTSICGVYDGLRVFTLIYWRQKWRRPANNFWIFNCVDAVQHVKGTKDLC